MKQLSERLHFPNFNRLLQVFHDALKPQWPQSDRDFIVIIVMVPHQQKQPHTEWNWKITTHFLLLLTSGSQAVDMVAQLEAWCKSFLKWHFQLTLPCHFGPESTHLHKGSLIYRFTNMCCHLFSLVQNVNYWPESLTGSGWVRGSAAIRCSHQNPQINRSYLSS